MIIEIDNIWLLRSLHKILHKMKFYIGDDDSFSPHAAKLSNIVLDNIINYYIEQNDETEIELWENWRNLDRDRIEFNIILKRLMEEKIIFTQLNSSQKEELIKVVSSPFKLKQEIIDEFIEKLS